MSAPLTGDRSVPVTARSVSLVWRRFSSTKPPPAADTSLRTLSVSTPCSAKTSSSPAADSANHGGIMNWIRRTALFLGIVLVPIGAASITARAAAPAALHAGDLDPTFGTGGKVSTDFDPHFEAAAAVAIQTDGKIVAAGDT